MVDALHTPGPWHVENRIHVKAENGWLVATASVPSGRVGSWGINPADNARLIAAAPDLLAAAERALNFITNTEGEMGETLESGDLLRAAIAAIIETQRLDAELADTFGDEALTDAGEGGWHIARMIRTGDHYGKAEQ